MYSINSLIPINSLIRSACSAAIVIVFATPSFAQSTASTSCVIRNLNEIEIPALQDGLISELTVNRGHRVSKNQRLAALDPTESKLRLEVSQAEFARAKSLAESDAKIVTAQTKVQRAAKEFELLKELGNDAVYLERFRIENDLARSRSELLVAQNDLNQDKLTAKIKLNETRIIENQIKQLVVNSPVDGIVKELKRDQGEWVRKGEAIAVLTRMDRLVAEGFLDYSRYPVHRILGARATLLLEIEPGRIISFESLEVQRASPELELDEKYPVWVIVDNRLVENKSGIKHWQLRPGMRAELKIHFNEQLSKK